MILTDKLGCLIYPGQIHGLSVVEAQEAPLFYLRPEKAAFALVVEGETLDHDAGGRAYMSETRYVLAWFDRECLATAALEELMASLSIVYQISLREICEGEL